VSTEKFGSPAADYNAKKIPAAVDGKIFAMFAALKIFNYG